MSWDVIQLSSQGTKGGRSLQLVGASLGTLPQSLSTTCVELSCFQCLEKILSYFSSHLLMTTHGVGIIVNAQGLIGPALQHFISAVENKIPIRPSWSLNLEASAWANQLAAKFQLTALVESLLLPFAQDLLGQRVQIALHNFELKGLCVFDLYRPDTEQEKFIAYLYRRKAHVLTTLRTTRIGIAGLGILSPYGYGLNRLTQGLLSTQLPSPLPLLTQTDPKRLQGVYPAHPLASNLLQKVLVEALQQANLPDDPTLTHRPAFENTAFIVVTRAGSVSFLADAHFEIQSWLGDRADWFTQLTQYHPPLFQISAACASVFFAIRLAQDLLQHPHYKRVFIIGVDFINTFESAGLHAVKALSPTRARPFDKRRDGIHLCEGAGVLILEDSTSLANRGQQALAWIDACQTYIAAPTTALTCPEAILYTMHACLKQYSTSVDAVQVHATGTVKGDLSEAEALCALFTKQKVPPVFSSKGAIGHSLYISGFHAIAASLGSLQTQQLMPTLACEQLDPAIHLDIVQAPRPHRIRTILMNSIGFAGNYSSLLLRHALEHKSQAS